MADKQDVSTLYKKEIKLPASIGDWTTYRPPKPAAKKIKPVLYGFHRISRPDLEKTLKIHHLFAFEFSSYLKEALKAAIDTHNISIEQLTYLDFLKRISGGIIYNKIAVKDIGEVMLVLDYQLANMMINFSLGCQTADTKIKELTELEESILQSIISNVLDKYAACWNNIFEKPSFEIVSYPNLQRETHINLNEVITIITMQISLANSLPAMLTFIYQNNTLKKLHETLLKKEGSTPLNFSLLPDALLQSIEVPVAVELGTTCVPTQELTCIETGDLICLDQKLHDPVRLTIGYAAQPKAQPGIKNGHLAVRILASGVKKIKSTVTVKPEQEAAAPEQTQAEEPATIAEPAAGMEEEEFELPLEDEGKEGYNEVEENIFGEENDTGPAESLGGK